MVRQRIPARRGVGFEIQAGDSFAVIDPFGGQVADLVAFDVDDVTERFSTKYTSGQQGTLRITTGDELLTTEGEPILTITADDCGIHDLLYAPCNNWSVHSEDGRQQARGCRENLFEALGQFGVSSDRLHNTLNVFMRSIITDHASFDVGEPPSQPGDTVEFTAEKDAYVGVCACASESSVNEYSPAPIDIRVSDGTEIHSNF